MDFTQFRELLCRHFNSICQDRNVLFFTDVDKNQLWDLYLDSFPEGTNEIFRERREFDCSCCKQFIRSFGNVVIINDNNELKSIWDFQTNDNKFQPVINTLSKFVKSSNIKDVFITKDSAFGTDHNFEKLENGDIITWNHFQIKLPERFITKSSKSVNDLIGDYRDQRNVFQRSLNELSINSIETVLELINQKSLYKGDEWKAVLNKFLNIKKEYDTLNEDKKDNYCWRTFQEVGVAISKIRNHSIGVLLTDITNDVELDEAVKRYEKIVAPTNYKRPKAIFTQKMVEQAKQKAEEIGIANSLGRRHSTLDDITINNILFANKDASKRMANENVFDILQKDAEVVNPKKFSKVENVDIDHFINAILPNVEDIELLFENRLSNNLVSLIAPKNYNSGLLFKWNNNFSWAYSGNITDSMKERVKAAGGNIEGVLRFSIQWNDQNYDPNDLDAHCIEPSGNHIHYPNKGTVHPSTGMLDIDIVHPTSGVPSIENITWQDTRKMSEGIYTFFVHNYTHRGGKEGFSAEIEFNDEIYSFNYNRELKHDENVTVAKIKFDKKEGFKMIESLESSVSSKTIWNLDTNKFHPVTVMMYSPNYWDEQSGIGHKHYFFMLDQCKNNEDPNGFFNEFLKEELMPHKKVFEALGSKMRVSYTDDQLSGIGFSSTKRNSVIARIQGKFSRTIKINF